MRWPLYFVTLAVVADYISGLLFPLLKIIKGLATSLPLKVIHRC